MIEPWVGAEYWKTGLLLLGESVYLLEKDGVLVDRGPRHAIHLVEDCFDNPHLFRGFIATVSRGICGVPDPSPTHLREAWSRVAFTNYVATPVGIGASTRPSEPQWAAAKAEFPALLERLKPRRIIVLGKTMWSRMPGVDLMYTDDVQGYRLSDGSMAVCWALHHPSRGLSWRTLAAVIQFACGPELRGPAPD